MKKIYSFSFILFLLLPYCTNASLISPPVSDFIFPSISQKALVLAHEAKRPELESKITSGQFNFNTLNRLITETEDTLDNNFSFPLYKALQDFYTLIFTTVWNHYNDFVNPHSQKVMESTLKDLFNYFNEHYLVIDSRSTPSNLYPKYEFREYLVKYFLVLAGLNSLASQADQKSSYSNKQKKEFLNEAFKGIENSLTQAIEHYERYEEDDNLTHDERTRALFFKLKRNMHILASNFKKIIEPAVVGFEKEENILLTKLPEFSTAALKVAFGISALLMSYATLKISKPAVQVGNFLDKFHDPQKSLGALATAIGEHFDPIFSSIHKKIGTGLDQITGTLEKPGPITNFNETLVHLNGTKEKEGVLKKLNNVADSLNGTETKEGLIAIIELILVQARGDKEHAGTVARVNEFIHTTHVTIEQLNTTLHLLIGKPIIYTDANKIETVASVYDFIFGAASRARNAISGTQEPHRTATDDEINDLRQGAKNSSENNSPLSERIKDGKQEEKKQTPPESQGGMWSYFNWAINRKQ